MPFEPGPTETTISSARRRDPAATRQLLLETGRQLVFEQGTRESIDIRVADVVSAAGRTTGSAYQVWASQADYQRDLAIYIAETFDWVAPLTPEFVDTIVAAGLSFHDLIAAAARIYFDAFLSHDRFYLSLRFWSVREPSPELQKAINSGYEALNLELEPLFSHALTAYRRRLRDPFTARDLTTAMIAVVEGLALRIRFDSNSVRAVGGPTETIYINSLIAIVEYFTEEIDALQQEQPDPIA